jgi:hypothetical protein
LTFLCLQSSHLETKLVDSFHSGRKGEIAGVA